MDSLGSLTRKRGGGLAVTRGAHPREAGRDPRGRPRRPGRVGRAGRVPARKVERVRTRNPGASGGRDGGVAGAGRGAPPIGRRAPPRPAPRRGIKAAAAARCLQPRAPRLAPRPSPRPAPLAPARRPPPAMASILQLVGRWRLVDSKGFDEYMKELGEAPRPAAPASWRVWVCPGDPPHPGPGARPPRGAGLGGRRGPAAAPGFLAAFPAAAAGGAARAARTLCRRRCQAGARRGEGGTAVRRGRGVRRR